MINIVSIEMFFSYEHHMILIKTHHRYPCLYDYGDGYSNGMGNGDGFLYDYFHAQGKGGKRNLKGNGCD